MKAIAATIQLIALLTVAGAQQVQYRITALGLPNIGVTASAINDRGQVAGYLEGSLSFDQGYSHAFLYSNGQFQDLGVIGDYYSYATAINNHAQVVGGTTTVAFEDTFFQHPFLWSNGKMIDLGSLGDSVDPGTAYGINDLGVVVGFSNVISQVVGVDIRLYLPRGCNA